MPVTVIVSELEAQFLKEHGSENINGYALTYNPRDTLKILGALPQGEAKNRLSSRMAGVASQVGLPNVMFETPAPEPANDTSEPDEAPTRRQKKFRAPETE